MENLAVIAIAVVIGGIAGYFIRQYISLAMRKSADLDVKQALLKAKEESQKILEKANTQAEKLAQELKEKEEKKDNEFKINSDRLNKREENLDKRQNDLEAELENARSKVGEVKKLRDAIKVKIDEQDAKLQEIAGLSKEKALEKIMDRVESDFSEDITVRINKLEMQARDELAKRAQDILVSSMQRLAHSTASEHTTLNVMIPNDDIKGKIIGKEGRNIRAFETAAGVELIIDDTPGNIVISSFNPIRRHVAKLALENLILDGRIQPAKIEEFVEKAQAEINQIIKEKGEQAVLELGIYNLDPRVVTVIGRLFFRTSYGQNVLNHSIEMAHLSGMLAEEIGADVMIAKTGALVHDIGKALDHEVQGTHIEIGIRILRKFNVDERVITAMKSHHDDWPHESLEAVIVQTADMISGGRPGARRDTLESYLKRLEDLEAVANSYPGVSKSYALSAGREIRIFVTPEKINDSQAHTIAKGVARQIENELTYPGQIKVTVIRENRVIEYAR